MSDEHTPLTPAEEAAQRAVQSLPPVAADPGFQARLEREFISGRLSAGPPVVLPARRFPWGSLLRWAYIPAAAVLLLAVSISFNRGGGWEVAPLQEGLITVDGREIEAIEGSALKAALGRGGELDTGAEASLEITRPGRIALEVDPGAHVELPAPPGRWWDRNVTFHVEDGELRLMTGPSFSGQSLVIVTPESRTEIVGTLVSVYRDEGGTCVCVMHGTARVGPPGGEMKPVPPGMRMVLPVGKEPYVTEIMPDHEAGMKAFEERLKPSKWH